MRDGDESWTQRSLKAARRVELGLSLRKTDPKKDRPEDPMLTLVDHPLVLFVVMLVMLAGGVATGAYVVRPLVALSEDEREDFKIVQTATLTLLALLIGFCLSMAVSRYDQRKNLEENEANAIGTEYVRADLAGDVIGAQIKSNLTRYTQLRLADFKTRNPSELASINRDTAAIQSSLWRLATQVGVEKPTPMGALVVAGMNDVLNSQDYGGRACQSYSHRGMATHAADCDRWVCDPRLWHAGKTLQRAIHYAFADNGFPVARIHCRYRQPPRRHHSRRTPKSDATFAIDGVRELIENSVGAL